MIATKETFEAKTHGHLPNSTRVYVEGEIHSELRVPFRAISHADTKLSDGRTEANLPIRV